MPNQTPSCKSKKTIDDLAADAIGEIDKALKALKADKELELGLSRARQDLVDIMGDNHSPGQ
jgi:hypothetical protein